MNDAPSLAGFLLGRTRAAVLSELLLHPDTALHVRALARATGANAGSLHRELRGLADVGVLSREEVGRQVLYRANLACPVFPELRSLLKKTSGLADVLRDALAPLGGKVKVAFVYGSVAHGTESANSDIDLMVLGSVGFADLARALAAAQASLGREINPTIMSQREFARRQAEREAFTASVVAGPRIWVKGNNDDIAELAAHRPA